MTKEVLLSIKGLQLIDGDENPVEVVVPAECFLKNEKHFIIYDELIPDMPGEVIKNTIKISNQQVDIMKKGTINAQMIFAMGKKMQTCYSTPMGDLLIGIFTNNIAIAETNQEIKVVIDYLLEINEQELAECKIDIVISERFPIV